MTRVMKKDEKKHPEKDEFLAPDEETLHTKDPQKNMEGPVSSAMHGLGDAFETDETKKEADEKREENM
jgi:hypothetical protein